VLLVLLVVWAVFASPFLLGLYFAARRVGANGLRSRWVRAGGALAVALVVAPTPTPIITIFVPQLVAVVAMLSPGDAMAVFAPELWPIMAASTAVTSVAAYLLSARLVGSLEGRANERRASG
jgi:hypothetical protein